MATRMLPDKLCISERGKNLLDRTEYRDLWLVDCKPNTISRLRVGTSDLVYYFMFSSQPGEPRP